MSPPRSRSWDVDPYEYYPAQLGEMFKAMLHSLGLINRFCIPVAALDNFWTKVCESYNDVPFHSACTQAFSLGAPCDLSLSAGFVGVLCVLF